MGGGEVGGNGFSYDPEIHRYAFGSEGIPGITQTLDFVGLYDRRRFTEASRLIGKLTHQGCQYFAEGDLDWKSVDPSIRPRVEQFARFWEEMTPELILAEMPLGSRQWRFGGTPDLFVKMAGEFALIDIKTGKAGLAAELQTAAQEILVAEELKLPAPIKRFALELPAEGKYRLIHHKERGDRTMFLNAVAIVHRRINAGELKI